MIHIRILMQFCCEFFHTMLTMAERKINLSPLFLVTSQVQHLLLSSIQYQYSQTIVIASNVTAQVYLLGCLPPLLLIAEN